MVHCFCMKLPFRRYARFGVCLAVVLVLFAYAGGASHLAMSVGGDMMPCPFADTTSLCDMTPLEHVSAWQSVFTALPYYDACLLLLCVAVFLFVAVRARFRRELLHLFVRYRVHIALPPVPAMALQEVFSAGILNPKPF